MGNRVSIRTVIAGAALAILCCGPSHAQQGSHTGATSVQTQPLSPSVLATIAFRNQNLELVVLWRGAPGWFLESARRSASGSGGEGGTFSAALEYGGLQLNVSYDPARRTVRVQETTVSLPDGANVILVDTHGPATSVSVSGVASVSTRVEGNPSLASLFGNSSEIVSFLRCDAGTPDPATSRKLMELMCVDLQK